MRVSPKCGKLWRIIPKTFSLPKDYIEFLDEFTDNQGKETNLWILKPVGGSMGRGISVINDLNSITYGEPVVI